MPTARPKPKAPRRQDRVAAILRAAEDVFVEQGYEAASLDEVARRAKASKATIYAHFDSKMGLFEAIVTAHLKEVQVPLHEATLPAGDALRRFGVNFLSLMLSPPVISLYRMMVSKGPDMPELVKLWYTRGPRRMIGGIAEFLTARTRAGELDVPDPDTAAEFFVMSLRGTLQLQVVTGLRKPPVPGAEIAAKVDAAVALFLRAFANAPSPARRIAK